jgi:DNA-binding NarL/FixJ family response regulator
MKALIVDSQWISRAGLTHLLSLIDPKCTVSQASDLSEALSVLSKNKCDICLMDPALADIAPLDAVRRLRAIAGEIPIAVVSDRESRLFALQAVEAGAQAYIVKKSSAEDIRRAIERVLGGEISLPANLRDLPGHDESKSGLSEAPASYTSSNGHDPVSALTPRQRDVLGLIATGKRNAEIGEVLEISPRTVQIHVSTILKLLGVGNRTEAALLARKHGLGA